MESSRSDKVEAWLEMTRKGGIEQSDGESNQSEWSLGLTQDQDRDTTANGRHQERQREDWDVVKMDDSGSNGTTLFEDIDGSMEEASASNQRILPTISIQGPKVWMVDRLHLLQCSKSIESLELPSSLDIWAGLNRNDYRLVLLALPCGFRDIGREAGLGSAHINGLQILRD